MSASKYLIVGGGMAAGYAAKEMVERGLKAGELRIISADDTLPYERPPLSKGFLAGKDDEKSILINSGDWYDKHGIDVMLRTTVSNVDAQAKTVRTNSGQEFTYEKVLIATGCGPRTLDLPGSKLGNVFYLRSADDSRKIKAAAAKAKKAVVIGSGFIGMEVTAVLTQKKIRTTMIFPEERVWKRVFTPEMSAFFEGYYKERGVKILAKTKVRGFGGRGTANTRKVNGGRKIPCDLVVIGAGAVPVTDLFAKMGLSTKDGVAVNEFLETERKDVFAAGDIANYPDKIFDKRRRVEHWDNAVSQGQHWARVAMGDRKPFVHVPYFFSDDFDLSYELWGDSEGATQTVTRGDVKTKSFSVWWLKQNRLIAAFTMNRPDEEREAAPEWIKARQNVSAERLGDGKRAVKEAAEAPKRSSKD